ncbi:pyruvate formate lyase-activating protein [Labedella populi]|uniref:Pyruvate formate-lyase-activating enzyme n=1 Tax=Labedella populi TaxID=2498850 RepID=A0A3S4A321_9MICO|nr:pyruvate formate-lyase-activating protein [Labedella populi]RWZ59219.1 pyruvate formate lyase-activating protein [Labedella populi]
MTMGTVPATGEPLGADGGHLAVPADEAGRLLEAGRSLELAARRAGNAGVVHSWELVTAVDGPGTRMTLFLSGCPLRCQYCQNPDTWHMRDGEHTALETIVDRLERYRGVFAATGGGLTISGGEPLMQSAFVAAIFAACRRLGIHTALDTSGNLGARASDALLDDTDLVLLDVKSGIPETYQEVTARELAPTVAFGDRLSARGNHMWIRFVLVPGLTDAYDNVEAVADIVSRWSTVDRVEVLPFHQMGASKWERLGVPYTLAETRAPDDRLLERVRAQFRSRGLTVW